jgi:hypothetical protein
MKRISSSKTIKGIEIQEPKTYIVDMEAIVEEAKVMPRIVNIYFSLIFLIIVFSINY